MSTFSDMFEELLEADCQRDQTVINQNLHSRQIDIEHKAHGLSVRSFGFISKPIPINDDKAWLKIQTVPRTAAEAFA